MHASRGYRSADGARNPNARDLDFMNTRPYVLLGADGEALASATPGQIGGNRRLRIYGRLDCTSARRALSKGYARHRVFFADEATAIAAGYRPCGTCMREAYARWKSSRSRTGDARPRDSRRTVDASGPIERSHP